MAFQGFRRPRRALSMREPVLGGLVELLAAEGRPILSARLLTSCAISSASFNLEKIVEAVPSSRQVRGVGSQVSANLLEDRPVGRPSSFTAQRSVTACPYIMPPMPPISGMPPATPAFSCGSATIASVMRMFLAIEAAFCSAERVTIVGSMMRP